MKYTFSVKRILLRLIQTTILGIIFCLLIIPFLQTADNQYDMQQAAIGMQNSWRIVFLWGIFTLLTTTITFWKKRMRLVAVLLLVCWLSGTVIVVWTTFRSEEKESCQRAQIYPSTLEFARSLDHIAKRMTVTDSVDSYLALAFQYKNCINIQYSDELNNSSEGVFVESDPTLQNMQIFLKPYYKRFDDLTISTILVHELTHVGQYIQKINTGEILSCFDNEANAFVSEAVYLYQLNEEERRSIYSRLQNNMTLNPAFQIVLLFDQRSSEVLNACNRVKKSNLLNDAQFDQCYWEGFKNKLKMDITNNKYYQEQCKE